MTLGSKLLTVLRPPQLAVGKIKSNEMTSLLVPPASVRGMKSLDRDAFTTTVDIPYILFRNITISKFIPVLKKYLLKIKKFKPVQIVDRDATVYLNPSLIKEFTCIEESDREKLVGLYDQFGKTKIELTYENWTPKDILRAILPEDVDVPASYSSVGHLIHLNLGEEHLPYETVIGQVYLDHLSNVRTVVKKVDAINTTYRHFAMKVLAGDNDTLVTVKENGCTYKFDFARVYWNSRLLTEHKNLVDKMAKGDTLYDVFAGIGPFAIPASRKGITVLANDLNPESFKWLQTNAKANKATNNFEAFNMDGRDFLRNVVKPHLLERRAKSTAGTEHIAMNLPAIAVEFLDVFADWCNEEEAKKISLRSPIVHLYCFVKVNKDDDACNLAKSLVEQQLGYTLSSNALVDTHFVRTVAPNKDMVRVSFRLTEGGCTSEEPATKRLKTEANDKICTNDISEKHGQDKGASEESEGQKCIQSSGGT